MLEYSMTSRPQQLIILNYQAQQVLGLLSDCIDRWQHIASQDILQYLLFRIAFEGELLAEEQKEDDP